MKKLLVLIILIFVAGCPGNMENGLVALMGKDVDTAFNVIGYPSSKNEFGNKTVYYWSVNKSTTMFLPQTRTTSGTVGMTPFYGTTTYNQSIPLNCVCEITLTANKNGKLINYDFYGNNCGCRIYIDRLSRYYDSQKTSIRE